MGLLDRVTGVLGGGGQDSGNPMLDLVMQTQKNAG
jgi:hypothetical protein